jgi:hypothetical protein
MSDDTTQRALERRSIIPKEEHEVRDGCRSPGCAPGQLRAAVKAAGSPADAVRQHLARK